MLHGVHAAPPGDASKLNKVEAAEATLDIDALVDEAVAGVETVVLRPEE